jgi:SAM-dependent methyltransferase
VSGVTEEDVRRFAAESLAVDDPTGWFERLYAAAAHGTAVVPWDRGAPNPMLVEWAQPRTADPCGRRAIVVGCGLGQDAEYVAGLGYDTTAFDVSATAVATARSRYPDSPVRYTTADLLDPPAEWRTAFDLVVETFTVQALPPAKHPRAIANVTRLVAPGGTLIVISAGRTAAHPAAGPPWPLTRSEIGQYAVNGLRPVRIEQYPLPNWPHLLRFRAEFCR